MVFSLICARSCPSRLRAWEIDPPEKGATALASDFSILKNDTSIFSTSFDCNGWKLINQQRDLIVSLNLPGNGVQRIKTTPSGVLLNFLEERFEPVHSLNEHLILEQNGILYHHIPLTKTS